MGSRGEAILEAAPQFALQCYIALNTLDPDWTHYFSIITSALTLSIPNIEQYVTARSEEFGPKSILKNIAVFCPGSLFRILTLSILGVFLNMWAGALISVFMEILALILIIIIRWYKLSEEKGTWQQFGECCLLSWLTITNLANGKTSALFRMLSSVFWTVVHTVFLVDILNSYKNGNKYAIWTYYDNRSANNLVQNPFILHIVLISTLCLGWLALVQDVITTAAKYCCCRPRDNNKKDQDNKASFWDGAIFLEGMKYFCRCFE